MKKYIFYVIVLIAITNCSNILFAQSAKDKFDALNDYLETVEGFSSKKIIVIKEKVSANMTIDILKINDLCSVDSNGKRKEDNTFYNEKDWQIMKKRYENPLTTINDNWLEDSSWTDSDFRHKEIIFISIKGRTWEVAFKGYSSLENYVVYSFTEPIYYKKNSYLVFTIHKTDVIGALGGSTAIKFMQKRNGKWVCTYEGYPNWRS